MAGMEFEKHEEIFPCKTCKYSKVVGGWTWFCQHPEQKVSCRYRSYVTECNIGKYEPKPENRAKINGTPWVNIK